MHNNRVQRPGNAGATGGATGGATPVQRPGNGGRTLSILTYGVAPALERVRCLVPAFGGVDLG